MSPRVEPSKIKLFGLGVHPPTDTMLSVLGEMRRCRVVFTDLADEDHFRWIKRHRMNVRRLRRPEEVLKAAQQGGEAVGFAVWGHPQYTSPSARKVMALCEKKGLAWEAYGTPCPMGVALARTSTFIGWEPGAYWGVTMVDAARVMSASPRLETRFPLVVFAQDGARTDWAKVKEALLAHYPRDQELSLLGRTGARERRMTLGEMAEGPGAGVLLILAKGFAFPRRGRARKASWER